MSRRISDADYKMSFIGLVSCSTGLGGWKEDNNSVMGAMVFKGVKEPFFFKLNRENT
jgi:hypothetical protein